MRDVPDPPFAGWDPPSYRVDARGKVVGAEPGAPSNWGRFGEVDQLIGVQVAHYSTSSPSSFFTSQSLNNRAGDLNALAFGVLVPMFGVGMNGVWAARHGAYGPRVGKPVSPADHEID